MSHNNYRNKVQEYCQKHKLDIPIYEISQMGIETYEFNAFAKFNDKIYRTCEKYHNKVQAINAVAKLIYDDLNTFYVICPPNKTELNRTNIVYNNRDELFFYLGTLYRRYDPKDVVKIICFADEKEAIQKLNEQHKLSKINFEIL
jgi:hypothetical protein